MPQRHSKNNNDLAFFTYDERKKLGYGTQKERLGKDSIKPFDFCCICLQPVIDPLCCLKGHLFCKECIFECLLAQKKDIKRCFVPSFRDIFNQMTELREVFSTGTRASRKVAAFNLQQKQDQEEELEKRTLERERQLDAFDHQNSSAVPHQQGTQLADGRHAFHGANSVRVTAYEEEALRTMKAFWLPSATPEAQERVQALLMDTCCPQGNEKLRLKDLFPITFTDVPHQEKEINMHAVKYLCPSCSVTFTNTQMLVAVSSCGHVFCKKCADQFVAQDKSCLACNKVCKSKNLVVLEKGGTGFSGHDENLEATTFKHVGSGTGMGLSRPTTQL